jgi:hypothetical protein
MLDKGRVREVSETMVLREREEAVLDIDRTTAFVARPAVSQREASVAQPLTNDQTANERTQVQRVQEVSPTIEPSEGAQALTVPLVQSGLTAVVRRSDLEASVPAPVTPSVPVTVWTSDPVAPAVWSAAAQHPGPGAPGSSFASTIHRKKALEPAGAVTLPVVWIVVAFVVTIAAGVALGVWMAG